MDYSKLYKYINGARAVQREVDRYMTSWNEEHITEALHEELHEWFNSVGSFKDWKKNKTPVNIQLDELADCLAFTLSLMNNNNIVFTEVECKAFLNKFTDDYIELNKELLLNGKSFSKRAFATVYEKDIVFSLDLVLEIATIFYSIDDLLVAYKLKSKVNIDRQKAGY